MEKIIPTFYSEYGRYISRFRMIPSNIDGLIPVERRLLLVMYEIAKNKPVKSAKIVGTAMSSYHPHGDSSLYGTLVNLVRAGFGDNTRSTWGGPGLEDASAPGMRYTETGLSPWVSEFAFEYIKNVPWKELELDSEPLYLPGILPIGLIGDGIINGIAFHKTVIPKYKKKDLASRLLWLIDNGKPNIPKCWESKMPESKFGPKISPNKSDCEVTEEESNSFYKLLMFGEGVVSYSPIIKKEKDLSSNKKIKPEIITIYGRAPNATFRPLLSDYGKGKLPFADKPIDQSSGNNIIIYIEPKRGSDIDDVVECVKSDYLVKKINFKCYFCDLSGVVNQTSIDDILLQCYAYWKIAALTKLINDITVINSSIVNNLICLNIKNIIQKNKQISLISEIIDKFDYSQEIKITSYVKEDTNFLWKEYSLKINREQVANVCNHSTIKKLIEFDSIENELRKQFESVREKIEKHDTECRNRVFELTSC